MKEIAGIWSAGNDEKVYLVLSRKADRNNGFQIYSRLKSDNDFVVGRWYSGAPAQVAAVENRLLIFLGRGGCQSYDKRTSYTEQRLEEKLVVRACRYFNNKLYVIAEANQALTVPVYSQVKLPSSVSGQSVTEIDPNSQAGNAKNAGFKLSLQKGDRIVMVRDQKSHWRSLCRRVLPIADWSASSCQIGFQGDIIYLFGISNQTLQFSRLREGGFTEPESVSIDSPVAAISTVNANHQLRIIVAVNDLQGEDIHKRNTENNTQYRIGLFTDDRWIFSDPIEKTSGSVLMASAETVSFCGFGQNIAAFQRKSDHEVLFGQYSLKGELIENLSHSILADQHQRMPLLDWFFSSYLLMAIGAIVFALVFWRRGDAFSQAALPDFIRVASIWRRFLAFFIDASIVFLINQFIFFFIQIIFYPDMFNDISELNNIWEQAQKGYFDPRIVKIGGYFWLTYYLSLPIYYLAGELLFAATLGKIILGLKIISLEGESLTRKQIWIRNLSRLLEMHPRIILFTFLFILISRYSQRVGDLAARTIVIEKKHTPINGKNQS